MKNKKYIRIGIVAAVCLLAAVSVVLAMNVSFGMSTDAHAAMSIAFDKQAMRSANRIVIRTYGKEIEITDPALVGEIAEETAAATHMKLDCPEGKWIDVYCDDQLIRSMGWSACCDTVNVFDTDATHWVMSIEGAEEGGSIYLSRDLVEKLKALINAG